MRRRIVGVRGALAALVLVVVSLAVTGCQSAPTTLKGTLEIGGGPAPAGVAVAVFADTAPTLVAEKFTDSQGKFAFDAHALPAGTYRVRFGDGSWFDGATDWSGASAVTIEAATPTVVDATIAAPTGGISGTLTRQSGRPISGATVAAVARSNPSAVLATTTTDAQGNYEISGLSMTEVLMHFTGVGYAETWSGGAAVATAATPIASDGATVVTGVDAVLAPEGTITGQLAGSTDGWDGIVIAVLDRDTGEVIGAGTVDGYGNFSVGGLAAGTFAIRVFDATGAFATQVLGSDSNDLQSGTGYQVAAGGTKAIGQVVLHGADCPTGASGGDFTGADLSGKSLLNCNFGGANLTNADLHDADLRGATFSGATVEHADLSGARLDGASFFTTDLVGANLAGAAVSRTNLKAANVQGVDFGSSALTGIRSGDLVGSPAVLPAGYSLFDGYLLGPGADVSNADFTGLDLSGRDLSAMTATNTNFTNATLTGTTWPTHTFTGRPWAVPI